MQVGLRSLDDLAPLRQLLLSFGEARDGRFQLRRRGLTVALPLALCLRQPLPLLRQLRPLVGQIAGQLFQRRQPPLERLLLGGHSGSTLRLRRGWGGRRFRGGGRRRGGRGRGGVSLHRHSEGRGGWDRRGRHLLLAVAHLLGQPLQFLLLFQNLVALVQDAIFQALRLDLQAAQLRSQA